MSELVPKITSTSSDYVNSIGDIIKVGRKGNTFHRPDGKFLSRHELETIKTHAEQIRHGLPQSSDENLAEKSISEESLRHTPYNNLNIRALAREGRRARELGDKTILFKIEDEVQERIIQHAERNGWDNKKTDDALQYFIDTIYGKERSLELEVSEPLVEVGDSWDNDNLGGGQDLDAWLGQDIDVSTLPPVFQIPLNGNGENHDIPPAAEDTNPDNTLGVPEEGDAVYYTNSQSDLLNGGKEGQVLITYPTEEREATTKFPKDRRLGAVAVGGWRAVRGSISRHGHRDVAADTAASERKTKRRRRLVIGAAALAAAAFAVVVYRSHDDKPPGGYATANATPTVEAGAPIADIREGDPYYLDLGTPVTIPEAVEESAPTVLVTATIETTVPAVAAPSPTPEMAATVEVTPEPTTIVVTGERVKPAGNPILEEEVTEPTPTVEVVEPTATPEPAESSTRNENASNTSSTEGRRSPHTGNSSRGAVSISNHEDSENDSSQEESDQTIEQLGPELTIESGDGFTDLLLQYRPDLSAEESYELFKYLVKKCNGAENILINVTVYEMPNGDPGIKYTGTTRFAPGVQEAVDAWVPGQ